MAAEALARLGRFGPLFEEVGSLVILTAPHPRLGAAPALPLRRGAGRSDLFVLRPLLAAAADLDFALNLGAPGLQAAGPLQVFGSLDRLGGFFVLTAIRWIGPIVTAVVVGGVAGNAITADLGARKIREGFDALQVLGVDPIKNLVVPRFIALVMVTALLDVVAIVFGLLAGIVAELLYRQSLGGFFATLFSQASATDVWASVSMCGIFGAIIAVVCCYKGMTASGGAAGVGRAVNQAVVSPSSASSPSTTSSPRCCWRRTRNCRRSMKGRAAGRERGCPFSHEKRGGSFGACRVPLVGGWLDSFGEIGRFGGERRSGSSGAARRCGSSGRR